VRKVVVAIAGGGAVLAAEVWLWFSVWLLPTLAYALNVAALFVALVVLAVLAWKKRPLGVGFASAIACSLPMLSAPLADAIGSARVREAQAYCESGCTGARPALFAPGYSARYAARCDESTCTFPDPFPGRTFWQGERARDGKWTWERLMD